MTVGKYGYSFATFQIGVEVIARLSQEEAQRAADAEAAAARAAAASATVSATTTTTEPTSIVTMTVIEATSQAENTEGEAKSPPPRPVTALPPEIARVRYFCMR